MIALDIGFFVQCEDNTIAEFFLVGAQRTNEITKTLGEHRYGTVDQIDTSGTLHGLFVDDRALLDIMADISDMYTNLVLSVCDGTKTQCIVKVLSILGVDGTGKHLTEVLTTTNLLWGDARIYFLSSLFNMLRIFVRESVLCQDGMHLHIVVAFLTQHVNHFAHDILGILRRPLGDFDNCLFTGLSTFQFLFRYQDIMHEDVTLSHQEGIVLLHLQLTNSLVHLV